VRDLVVQLDREIERVLTTSVLRLIDRFLDVRELAFQIFERGRHRLLRAVALGVLRLLEPIVHLLAHLAHRDH